LKNQYKEANMKYPKINTSKRNQDKLSAIKKLAMDALYFNTKQDYEEALYEILQATGLVEFDEDGWCEIIIEE